MTNRQVTALIIACCATIEVILLDYDFRKTVICCFINIFLFYQTTVFPKLINDDNEGDYSPIKISLVALSLFLYVFNLIITIFSDNYSDNQITKPILIASIIYYVIFLILYFIYNKDKEN